MPDKNMYTLYCQIQSEARKVPLSYERWKAREIKKRQAAFEVDFRVLMTGSREWTDNDRMYWALYQLYASIGIKNPLLVHGDARGADLTAAAQWQRMGGKTEAHPVSNDEVQRMGNRAYYLRNQRMVDKGAEVCIAFIKAKSRGTTMTAELAEAAGIRTIRIEEN